MVKVTCKLTDYSDQVKPEIIVHNHWNNNKFVEIEVDGKRFTILGQDMIEAVKNAMNTNKV